MKYSAHTKLVDFNIPYLRYVLEEVFALFPVTRGKCLDLAEGDPQTVEELAECSVTSVDDAIRRLREVQVLAKNWLVEEEPMDQDLVLWSDPLQKPNARFTNLRVNKLELSSIEDFSSFLEKRRCASGKTYVIASHAHEAFGAVVYMRQEGLEQVFALADSVTAAGFDHID